MQTSRFLKENVTEPHLYAEHKWNFQPVSFLFSLKVMHCQYVARKRWWRKWMGLECYALSTINITTTKKYIQFWSSTVGSEHFFLYLMLLLLFWMWCSKMMYVCFCGDRFIAYCTPGESFTNKNQQDRERLTWTKCHFFSQRAMYRDPTSILPHHRLTFV